MPERTLRPGVFVEEVPSGARSITGVSTSIAAFIGTAVQGPLNQPVQVRSFAEFVQDFGELSGSHPTANAVQGFFENGGSQAFVVRVDDANVDAVPSAGVLGDRAKKTGLYALEKVELFNLLCLLPNCETQDVSVETWREAAAYCRERRAMLIVDPPAAWSADSVLAFDAARNGIESYRSSIGLDFAESIVMLFPRVRRGGSNIAPSGAVAGVIARTDGQRGVWKAPAGQEATLRGIDGLDYNLRNHEIDVLNRLGLNCLRTLPEFGHVIWGARTMAGADTLGSEYKFIAVRRLALFLEESIHRGIDWVVFEPNNETLWARIRLSVDDFMHHLFRSGAFQGQTPSKAFFVKCDGETTTQADIDAGIVNVTVGFAPVRPAEFVILRFQQRTAMAE